MEAQKFNVVNLGCKVNRVEADALSASLLCSGAESVSLEEADLVVVNTCTVTGEAEKKARKAVRHALSANPSARVIVTGCSVAIDPDTFLRMDERVEVIQRVDLLDKLAGTKHEPKAGPALRMGDGFRTRVSLKVQDGCDHACTYCIVHVARGKARSVPLEDVVAEARPYLKGGVKEIVLTGIDLASYRDDSGGITELSRVLLEEADKLCPAGERPARLRISSMEPMTLEESFITLLAQSDGRICRHLHLPLQSGSSRVLAEMARPYSAQEYSELVMRLREAVPSLSLTTDIICGFPGETDADFEETLSLARACAFSKIHVFPYSIRKGTPAALRTDQVAAQVKSERAARLRAVSRELRAEDLARRSGTYELALVEGPTALSESYHEVSAPSDAAPGDLVPVKMNW